MYRVKVGIYSNFVILLEYVIIIIDLNNSIKIYVP